MKTLILFLVCCSVVVLCPSTRSAELTDVSSIEAIIAASYDSLSGPVGVPRQWKRYRNLLDPDARLASASLDATTGKLKIVRWSLDEYVRTVDDYLVSSGFIDRKLRCISNRYGSVAAVRCGFEGLEQSKLVERGVALYQLYHDGMRWWIVSVAWEQERPGHPTPLELRTRK